MHPPSYPHTHLPTNLLIHPTTHPTLARPSANQCTHPHARARARALAQTDTGRLPRRLALRALHPPQRAGHRWRDTDTRRHSLRAQVPGENEREGRTHILCVCAHAHACMRAYVHACVRACVRACVHACMRVREREGGEGGGREGRRERMFSRARESTRA